MIFIIPTTAFSLPIGLKSLAAGKQLLRHSSTASHAAALINHNHKQSREVIKLARPLYLYSLKWKSKMKIEVSCEEKT